MVGSKCNHMDLYKRVGNLVKMETDIGVKGPKPRIPAAIRSWESGMGWISSESVMGTSPANALISDHWSPEPRENKFLVF